MIILLVIFFVQMSNGNDSDKPDTLYPNNWQYCDFDKSMQSERFEHIIYRHETMRLVGVEGPILFDFFKNLYNKNNLSVIHPTNELKIPKIIHQIWIGSPVPEQFEGYIQSWVDRHLGPNWQYKLWTDKDVTNIELYNQQFYDKSNNYGIKADILKWEIIYQFGGVYADMDFECLQPLDIFHYTYDFYTGLQPLDTGLVQLGAALFAAWPGHPILKHCIETIKDDWHEKGVPQKTGPIHFTKSFYIMAGKGGQIDIALPAHYFYPLGSAKVELKKKAWTDNGSFAVHHWAKTWNKPRYRRRQFQSVQCGGTLL